MGHNFFKKFYVKNIFYWSPDSPDFKNIPFVEEFVTLNVSPRPEIFFLFFWRKKHIFSIAYFPRPQKYPTRRRKLNSNFQGLRYLISNPSLEKDFFIFFWKECIFTILGCVRWQKTVWVMFCMFCLNSRGYFVIKEWLKGRVILS